MIIFIPLILSYIIIIPISKKIWDYIEDNKENNSSNIKGLIKMFFDSRIKSNNDINNYFKLKKNHKTYVR